MTDTQQEKRVLAADAYDYFELSALVEGGIGADVFGAYNANIGRRTCHCIHGHTFERLASLRAAESNELFFALRGAGIDYGDNDRAVYAINRQRGVAPLESRVPWDLYVKELNIVRGD